MRGRACAFQLKSIIVYRVMGNNYLKVFTAAAGVGTVDNDYYCFEAQTEETDQAEVQRLVQEAQREMGRLNDELEEA